jgi:hypothetical protein
LPDNLDQINVTNRQYIRTKPGLTDNVFNQDPLNFFLRQNLREDWTGGSFISENFIYAPMIGGAYAKGKQFNVSMKQTMQQLRFDMKFTQVSVPLYQEDIRVLNKGPLAAVKLLKAKVDEAYMTLGAFVSIGTYLNGINAGYQFNVNGLAEALNDNGTASWDGNLYPTYGGLTRATFAPALNSVPLAVAGSIEYDTIDQAYMSVFYGSGNYEPNLMVTTPLGFSYLKAKYQTQQRFNDVTLKVGVGFRGMEINGATIVASRYCPGSYLTGPAGAGTADLPAVQFISESSQNSGNALAAYPVGSLGNNGESLFILNARKPFLNYYVDTDPLFGGGFRDYIPAANNTILVGQVLLAHQLTLNPRYHRHIYGFTS